MDLESIRVFLAVVDTGSISAAANLLYASQSSVSRRIAALEREIGVTLINRNKGQNTIILTPYGESFLRSARQMAVLYKDIETSVRTPFRQFLSIGANETSQGTFLDAFCPIFIDRHPEICLSIHSYHSSTIYQRLNEHFIDIGYVSIIKDASSTKSRLITEEPFVLITRKDSPYHANMTIQELPPNKEIYLRYNAQYEHWHNSIFPGRQYLLRVSRELMMASYLMKEGTWAVIGEPSGRILCSLKNDFVLYPLLNVPMKLTTYEVFRDDTRPSRINAERIFRSELNEYLESLRK